MHSPPLSREKESPLALVGIVALALLLVSAGLWAYYSFSPRPEGYSELSFVSAPVLDPQSNVQFSIRLVSHELDLMDYDLLVKIVGKSVYSHRVTLATNESRVFDFSIPSTNVNSGTFEVVVRAVRVETNLKEPRPALEVVDWLVVRP